MKKENIILLYNASTTLLWSFGLFWSQEKRKDELKKLQIIECLDEKIIKTTSLTSFTKDFNLLEETETYYLKYTYTDKNGNDYVVDSKFYEASINNLEVYFMGSKGYINNEERYMNIHK